MLNFLRQEIAKKEKEVKAFHVQEQELGSTEEQELDNAILEYAHLFAEMDELTNEGENIHRERPVINIPIEDDIELDLVEMDVTSGRIVDIPMDVQAIATEAYSKEKTFEDFYQEGMQKVKRFHRESNQSYDARVFEYATRRYEDYHAYIVQEGLFGNDMMHITDERVPATMMCDLGPLHLDKPESKHYIAKLPVFFELNNRNELSLNQIHALNVANNLNAFENLGEALRGLLIRDGYRRELYNNDVWDLATPVRVIVPTVMDKYVVAVEFDVDGMNKPYHVVWSIQTRLVRQGKNGKIENIDELKKKMSKEESGSKGEHQYKNIKVEKKDFDKMNLVCKRDFKKSEEKKIQEAFVPIRGRSLSYYQEAIDFNTGADPTAAPAPDPNAAPAPGGDTTAAPPAPDPTAAPAPAPDANAPAPEDMSTATTNDVSQQIADNVASATEANTANPDLMSTTPTFDNNVDDTFSSLDSAMDGTDMSTPDTNAPGGDMGGDLSTPDLGTPSGDDLGGGMDNPSELDMGNPAASLDDISTDIPDTTPTDDMGDTSSKTGEMGDLDIDNMSMDDLIAQATEKVKTMPIGQLKEFLNDGAGAVGTTPTGGDDLSLEAATSVASQVEIDLRKVLGDLNDEKKSLKQIVESVNEDGKKLSKTLARAIKTNEFDDKGKKVLTSMIHATNNLILNFKNSGVKEDIDNAKSSIRAFTSATKAALPVIKKSGNAVND